VTIAIDKRAHVRLWDRKSFTIIDEARVPDGEIPMHTVRALLRNSSLVEAVATTDWPDGSRWSGFVYLDRWGVGVIHHDEVQKLIEWPEFDNHGPTTGDSA
jgi:hypothetical protein